MIMQAVYILNHEVPCAHFNNFEVEFHIPFQGPNLSSISSFK